MPQWIVIALVAWIAVSIVTALVLGAAIRLRDTHESPRDANTESDSAEATRSDDP
ncbi:hypothetical protein GCM10023094_25600 [Rhodococcus olei]|uniref:Methionine/alanine importer small subunit n=1 Tax=Rhodococcus olei TaxID=2161675 RepID=A0ABP8P4F5_9NOCA